MLDIVKTLVSTCKDRFEKLDKMSFDIKKDIEVKSGVFDAENKKLKQMYHEKLESYISRELRDLRNDLQSLTEMLSKGLNVSDIKPVFVDELYDDGIDGCRMCVASTIKALNEKVEELNEFDFLEYNPPLVIKDADEQRCGPEKIILRRTQDDAIMVDKESYASADQKFVKYNVANGYPTSQRAKEVIAIALGAQVRLDTLENAIKRVYSEKEFDEYLNEEKKKALITETARVNEYFDRQMNDLLVVEDDVLCADNFRRIFESGERGKVDVDNGSADFKEYITLGDISVEISKKSEHGKYFKMSPVLTKYTKNNRIQCPFVMDLKKCGNIFVNIDEPGRYSLTTFKFVHEIIVSYLMSFPARRVRFLLLDVDDQGEFANYMRLKELDGFVSDIIRDERDLDGLIKDMEKNMHLTYDNKVAYNNCANIFEYNEKAVTNPESINVIVILNYPKGFNSDNTNRLLKIMGQGNRSGIFTVIFNNKAIAPQFSRVDYDKFLEDVKRDSNVFNIKGDSITMDLDMDNKFEPNEEINHTQIGKYIETLKESAEKVRQKVINFNSIFKLEDKQAASAKGVKPAYYSVDLPIGMRGSEFMGFELSTLGTSAHALAIGGTGSGKSNLLHAIVLSACYKYSPDELAIYLVDFKGGVEFKFYEGGGDVSKQLPHIRLTGLTSNPEDGVAILNNVLKELRRREDIFRAKTTEDIVQYNSKVKKEERVPRLVVIIDEVQELFERNEMLGQDAIKIMAELFKKGRAFGISLFWASQNVPKVAGIRDKIISQIGTRICLKLNNPEDASELGIKADRVRSLNKVEKGMALLYETNGQSKDGIEFRVAFAESSEKRRKFVEAINAKWKSVTDAWQDREPLFVVGNDKVPVANEGRTKFTEPVSKKSIVPKSSGTYQLNIGQNYISGKAFNIPIELRGSKSNLWMAGASMEELRDLMGFSMLSVIMENITNKDIPKGENNIYYVNGEIVAPDNPNDLFYVLPEKFSKYTTVIESKRELVDLFIKLLKLRRERSDRIHEKYAPVFVFINKLNAFTDLFKDNMRQYDINEKKEESPLAGGGSLFGGLTLGLGGEKGDKMTFTSIFNEVFGRGSDVGIHVIFGIDTPSSISEIEKEMSACVNKLVIKGVRGDDMLRMLSTARNSTPIQIEGLGYWYENNDVHKFKPYRYFDEHDAAWFNALADTYLELDK